MLTWNDLDLSVNEGGDGVYMERRRIRIPVPKRKKDKVVKRQEHRITESTPIPQTKSKKSTLPDDRIVGSVKGAMPIIPIIDDEDESGADGEKVKKETIVLPNLMQPSVEPVKVVNPKDWTFPLYKDKFVMLTVMGAVLGVLIAKRYNKDIGVAVALGAVAGIVLANAEVAFNKKEVEDKIVKIT